MSINWPWMQFASVFVDNLWIIAAKTEFFPEMRGTLKKMCYFETGFVSLAKICLSGEKNGIEEVFRGHPQAVCGNQGR